jgi:hypothetical protein
MNQKSSLREVPQFVSWVLTGNNRGTIERQEIGCEAGLRATSMERDDIFTISAMI